MSHNRKIVVIGLGYVGLPVAVAFGRSGASVIGYEIDPGRLEELRNGHDRTGEVSISDLEKAMRLSFLLVKQNASNIF